MSLFLRKACQDNLDGVGLANYHIQVDESTKCLQVVGECGDVLVSITGIRLSRMAPADKEIELAVSLFDDFLTKHTATFKEFMAAKARADIAYRPKEEDIKLSNVSTHDVREYRNGGNTIVMVLRFKMYYYESVEVEVKSTGKISIPAIIINEPKDVKELQPCLTPQESEAVLKWIADCKSFNDAIQQKDACLTILSTCEI